MKNIILSLSVLILSTQVYSQSKSETENWIISKFKKYAEEEYIKGVLPEVQHSIYNNYNFRFDDFYFIIEYDSESFWVLQSKGKRHCKILIPIYDIAEITSYSKLSIHTFKKTQKTLCGPDENAYVSDYSSLQFDANAETDLVERIQKAFTHLKKFYSKPKNSESF